MNKIYYIFFIFTLIYLVLKWKYNRGFWSKQPVFHYYDIHTWIYPKGVIKDSLLEKSNYHDPAVSTYTIDNIPKRELTQYIDLIRKHYIIDNDLSYNASRENIYAYMNHSGYTSLYKKEITITNPTKKSIYVIDNIISGLSSRPITFYHNNEKVDYSYYTDFLCTHKEYRKQNITPKMIYTHVYDVMKKNNHRCIYLFKREGEVSPFVPILSSYSYIYNIKYLNSVNIKDRISILCINKDNLYYLFEKIKEIKGSFSLFVYNTFFHILRLIENSNLYCYLFVDSNKSINAFYIFTNNYMKHKNENIIELSLTYKSDMCSDTLFYNGFISALQKISVNNLTYLVIDNIAHNNKIIEKMRYKPQEKTPFSYYIYNYASYTQDPNSCFILV